MGPLGIPASPCLAHDSRLHTRNLAVFGIPRTECSYHLLSTYCVLDGAPGTLHQMSTLILQTHFTDEETGVQRN